MNTPSNTSQRKASTWRCLLGGLAISSLLLYVVEAIAINNPYQVRTNNEVGNTAICPVFISSCVAIRLPHDSHNGMTLLQQSSELFVADRSIRNNRGVSGFGMTGRRIGRKDSSMPTDNNFGKLVLEPPVRLLHRIVPKEYFSGATRLNGRGFPVIAISKIHHEPPIAGEPILRNGHDVRPLILHEQGLSGIPLKTSKDRLPKGSDEYKRRQEFHSSSVALNPFLKAGYVAFLLVVAVAIVYYGHRQLIDKWNRQAFLKVLLTYVVGGGIIFHVVWVMLFA